MSSATAMQNTSNRRPTAVSAISESGAEQGLHRVLRRRGIALRCRTAELAGALRRFRERQAEIDAGCCETTIRMPPVATGNWLSTAA